MVDPDQAYAAAQAARNKRLTEEKAAATRAANFPAAAQAKLELFERALRAKTPKGLEIDVIYGKGGHLGPRGILSLLFHLKEHGAVIAQGVLSVSSDYTVAPAGFPPDRDSRPEIKFDEVKFDDYTPEMAINLMGDVIAHYLK